MAVNFDSLSKRDTSIPGLDAVTRGGLPDTAATLVIGEPSGGKIVLGLQSIARAGAQREYQACHRQLEREVEQAPSRGEQAHSETERIREELTRLEQDKRSSGRASAEHREAIVRRRDP